MSVASNNDVKKDSAFIITLQFLIVNSKMIGIIYIACSFYCSDAATSNDFCIHDRNALQHTQGKNVKLLKFTLFFKSFRVIIFYLVCLAGLVMIVHF